MKAKEVNFDGLVGPTHNYSGLSYGNIASLKNQSTISNPKEAALQGLNKMKFLHELGITQAILPPHPRPYLPILQELGFTGHETEIIRKTHQLNPELFFACCSAASMWTANAATVSPSSDTVDGKVHLSPANLSSKFHRSIEAALTEKILKTTFNNFDHFVVHAPLPQGSYFADEGAANHNRLCSSYSEPGTEMFVWGRYSFNSQSFAPTKFPARQTYEASQAIVRKHQLKEKILFVQQNPKAIDAGVFHNDVISVCNEYLFFCHEEAFVNQAEVLRKLKHDEKKLCVIQISSQRLSLEEAVNSYLFNSQIVTLPNQQMFLIAPIECAENPKITELLNEILQDPANPLSKVEFLNLRQSMANGGGPACLRLRVVLTEEELACIHQGILFTDTLYLQLKNWIEKYYRDRLHPSDLADPHLLKETQQALDEVTNILRLGPLYYFQ